MTEIESSGFGLLPLKLNTAEQNEEGQPNDGVSADENIESHFDTVEEFNKLIETNIKLMRPIKLETRRVIQVGCSKFPENSNLQKLVTDFSSMFMKDEKFTNEVLVNSQEAGTVSPCTAIVLSTVNPDDIWGSPGFEKIAVETAEKAEQQSAIMKSLPKMGDDGFDPFDLGISPDKKPVPLQVLHPADIRSPSVDFKGKNKVIVKENLNDNIKRNLTVEMQQVNLESDEILGKMTRRPMKPSFVSRSPFRVRTVDFNVSKEEDRIHEWALSAIGSDIDNIFMSKDWPSIDLISIEGIVAPNICTTPRLINGWVGILNYDERFRSDNSLRRFFFTLEVMGDPQLRMRYMDRRNQYKVFKKQLILACGNRMDCFEFRNIDLAFSPIKDCDEYYAVVMNMKKPKIQILDHRIWKGPKTASISSRYKFVTDILQHMMITHLHKLGHSAAVGYEKIEPEVLEMDWKIKQKGHDSGLFFNASLRNVYG